MTSYQKQALLEPIHNAANWFYWITGLSLVNLILAVAEADHHFLIGLSMSEFASGVMLMPDGGALTKIVGGVVVAIILIGYFVIGQLAHRPSKLAFIIGMSFYTLDGIIYVIFEDYFSAAFHGYVMYHFWMGFKAIDPYLAATDYDVIEEPVQEVVEEEVQTPEVVASAPATEEEDPYRQQ